MTTRREWVLAVTVALATTALAQIPYTLGYALAHPDTVFTGILMNPEDIRSMGLEVNQPVRIQSTAGEMRYILVRPFDIRQGNAAMYYPESNILVPHAVDPLSKTPAFKSIAINIQPEPTMQPVG